MVVPQQDATNGIKEISAEDSLGSFRYVEKAVRKRKFGVLSVVDPKGSPHSTGILYGVSHPDSRLAFYVITKKSAAKVRYLKKNPNVSLLVTFPHYYLRFAPDSTVMFRGIADFVTLDDKDVQWAFSQGRILQENLQVDSEVMRDAVVIRIKPHKTIYCYGIGVSINQLRKDPTAASYRITIPPDRLLSSEAPHKIVKVE